MINVNVVNEKLVKEQLKSSPQELKDYVKSLQDSCKRWEEINKIAVNKMKELSKK